MTKAGSGVLVKSEGQCQCWTNANWELHHLASSNKQKDKKYKKQRGQKVQKYRITSIYWMMLRSTFSALDERGKTVGGLNAKNHE